MKETIYVLINDGTYLEGVNVRSDCFWANNFINAKMFTTKIAASDYKKRHKIEADVCAVDIVPIHNENPLEKDEAN